MLIAILLFIALCWEVCKIATCVFHKKSSFTEALYETTEYTPTYIFCTFNPQFEVSAVIIMYCRDLCLTSSLSNNLFITSFLDNDVS